MAPITAHGITVKLPAGWDGRIAVRRDGNTEKLVTATGTHVLTALS